MPLLCSRRIAMSPQKRLASDAGHRTDVQRSLNLRSILSSFDANVLWFSYSPTGGDRSLSAAYFRQVEKAFEQSPGLHMGIVQDGAPEMWTLMRELLQPLQDSGSIQTWHEAIDLPHLMERLSQAFKVALGSSSSVLAFWQLRLLESNGTIDLIEAILKRRLSALADEDAATLQEHLTYIENNKDRMRYATMQKANLPIGSGINETPCGGHDWEEFERANPLKEGFEEFFGFLLPQGEHFFWQLVFHLLFQLVEALNHPDDALRLGVFFVREKFPPGMAPAVSEFHLGIGVGETFVHHVTIAKDCAFVRAEQLLRNRFASA